MQRWLDLYNGDDMHAFIYETYHPEQKTRMMSGTWGTGNSTHGLNRLDDRDAFVAAEKFIMDYLPTRQIRINRTIPAGNVVVIEASLIDTANPDYELAWCGVYTFKDGLIISDHSYINHAEWPGVLEALGLK
jgi:predicted SnoaL-like aldol condensation-catalyzing enzyme